MIIKLEDRQVDSEHLKDNEWIAYLATVKRFPEEFPKPENPCEYCKEYLKLDIEKHGYGLKGEQAKLLVKRGKKTVELFERTSHENMKNQLEELSQKLSK